MLDANKHLCFMCIQVQLDIEQLTVEVGAQKKVMFKVDQLPEKVRGSRVQHCKRSVVTRWLKWGCGRGEQQRCGVDVYLPALSTKASVLVGMVQGKRQAEAVASVLKNVRGQLETANTRLHEAEAAHKAICARETELQEEHARVINTLQKARIQVCLCLGRRTAPAQ